MHDIVFPTRAPLAYTPVVRAGHGRYARGLPPDRMTTPSKTSGHTPTMPADAAGALQAIDTTLASGTVVGEYEIEGKIGEGGFGTVYRAQHPLIGKTAAVKVLSLEFSANPEMVSRFVAEARAANTIRNQNIIDIFNFGRLDDGRHYFVMELLDGVSFERFIEEHGALDPPLVLAIMRPVARALDAAHAKGIVHRDLKPDNIFLTFDDEGKPVPKLLDFGIAKLLGDAAAISGHKTRTGTPVGTPHYMAPEQCSGEDVDELVDVYAFGVVCFEALTGKPPFTGKSFLELMNKQTRAPRPPVSSHNPGLDASFDEPVQRMMSLEKEGRPRTLSEAVGLLEVAARSAGFDVDAPSRVGSSARLKGLAFSGADTLAGGGVGAHTGAPSSAPIGASSSESRAGGKTLMLLGGVFGLSIVAYLASGSLTMSTDAPPPSANAMTAAVAPKVTAAAEPTSASSQPAVPGPPGLPSALPEVAERTFDLAVHVSPKSARFEVYLVEGDTKTKLERAGKQLSLTGMLGQEVNLAIRARGYREATQKVVLGGSASIAVTLRRKQQTRINKDLEDPFQ